MGSDRNAGGIQSAVANATRAGVYPKVDGVSLEFACHWVSSLPWLQPSKKGHSNTPQEETADPIANPTTFFLVTNPPLGSVPKPQLSDPTPIPTLPPKISRSSRSTKPLVPNSCDDSRTPPQERTVGSFQQPNPPTKRLPKNPHHHRLWKLRPPFWATIPI
mmetsp:Transcript_57053/g.68620  ORF Transcript_57053/g.68620 Transcript_57053/m.68620 type:complete len:161 (+) Transcript_57053:509-991(+)